MGRISNQDGINLDGEDENGGPPSPTLSNSPPSMVVPKNDDDYYQYYIRQCQKSGSLPLNRGSNLKLSTTTKQSSAWRSSRDCRDRFSPSSSSHNTWRPNNSSNEVHSNGTKKNDVMNSATTSAAAAAALSAASSGASENNFRNVSATADLWAQLHQYAAAAAVAASAIDDNDSYQHPRGVEGAIKIYLYSQQFNFSIFSCF